LHPLEIRAFPRRTRKYALRVSPRLLRKHVLQWRRLWPSSAEATVANRGLDDRHGGKSGGEHRPRRSGLLIARSSVRAASSSGPLTFESGSFGPGPEWLLKIMAMTESLPVSRRLPWVGVCPGTRRLTVGWRPCDLGSSGDHTQPWSGSRSWPSLWRLSSSHDGDGLPRSGRLLGSRSLTGWSARGPARASSSRLVVPSSPSLSTTPTSPTPTWSPWPG